MLKNTLYTLHTEFIFNRGAVAYLQKPVITWIRIENAGSPGDTGRTIGRSKMKKAGIAFMALLLAAGMTAAVPGAAAYAQEQTEMETQQAAHQHVWKNAGCTWNSDYSAATFHLVCKDDASHTMDVNAVITKNVMMPTTCTQDGKVRYFAKAAVGSGTFVDWKTVTVPAAGHDWQAQWTWSADYSQATLKLVCANNANHTYETTVKTVKETLAEPDCVTEGLYLYDAIADYDGQRFTDYKRQTAAANPDKHPWIDDVKWTWSPDRSSAQAVFTCWNDESHTLTKDAAVTKTVLKEPTCTEPGEAQYTAAVSAPDDQYTGDESNLTASETVEIPALGHDWGEAKWTWNEDYTKASVTRVCKNDPSHIETADAVITSEEKDGRKIYTASAVLGGETLTDTKTKEVSKEAAAAAQNGSNKNGTKDANAKAVNAKAAKPVKVTAASSAVKTADGSTPAVWGMMIAGGALAAGAACRRKSAKKKA